MKKQVDIIFSKEAEKEIKSLNRIIEIEKKKGIINSKNQQLLKSIKNKLELIENDPDYGDPVPKNLIKKAKLPVTNLWVVDLTNYWRMLYTLKGTKIEVICFVLRIFDHNSYNKMFGYKKK
ncbi:MAG: type II toxin-antitoxin system RelE/ParE family toxin [Candidatus Aenigmarchaeota archaeon]|nr:type II toxin-antitoxin system RelE/ParE family toxin [Candidatus Aenigmarchaeota archaeon]